MSPPAPPSPPPPLPSAHFGETLRVTSQGRVFLTILMIKKGQYAWLVLAGHESVTCVGEVHDLFYLPVAFIEGGTDVTWVLGKVTMVVVYVKWCVDMCVHACLRGRASLRYCAHARKFVSVRACLCMCIQQLTYLCLPGLSNNLVSPRVWRSWVITLWRCSTTASGGDTQLPTWYLVTAKWHRGSVVQTAHLSPHPSGI